MEVDAPPPETVPVTSSSSTSVPEGEFYLRLLIIHHLLGSDTTYSKALTLAQETVAKMQALNRRSMDPIAAKIWFAVERAFELGGELANGRP